MKIKSLFCVHSYDFSKIILPNGTERIKEHCIKCDTVKIRCYHDYEIIAKTFYEGSDIANFKGSYDTLKKILNQMAGITEILLKCKNCSELNKQSMKGKQVL